MNNIVLAATLLASLGFVFIAQRSALHNLRKESGRLAGESESSRLLTAEAAAGVASLKGKVEEQRSRRAVMRSSLSTEHAMGETIPMAREKEGVWPPDKPYFYLNKRRLADAFFRHITGDFHLAPEAAIALGMTPGEAATVDDAFHSVVETFHALEVEHLMPSTEHASTRFSKEGRKTSYRLPALKELMEPTVENFVASTRAILGDSRAEIFNHWAKQCFVENVGDFDPKARIFTLTDEEIKGGSKLTRLEVVEEGWKHFHYFELWDPPRAREYGLPEGAPPPFFYRHLFGENGGKRPGVEPLSR